MVSATKHDPPIAPPHPAASTSSSSAAAAETRAPPSSSTNTESRKRKRGDDGLAQKSITIRPCPAHPSDRTTTTLHPLRLLDRAQLPLSFLDFSATASSAIAPPTRLFSAYVEALERRPSSDDDAAPTPKVLVARCAADRTLFAVERVRFGVYALCKLGSWVKEGDIESVPAFATGAAAYQLPVKAEKVKDGDGAGAWWRAAAVEAAPAEKSGGERRIAMGRPAPRVAVAEDPFVDGAVQVVGEEKEEEEEEEEENDERRPQTPEEVFQAVVLQYLEALYLSKTSLAFFVKGPMSRARAAFTGREGAGMRVGDLAAFLRSILLQPGPMDKKHRERLPEIIKAMPLPGLSDDEDAAAAKKTKRSKSKRLKPSKDGMYPGEEEHVKKWWIQDRPGSSPSGQSESPADVLKRRLGELRIRESMAQVILVLEIMALEASPSFQAAGQEETQQQDETQAEPQIAPGKKRKPKKPQDLNVLLDLLLDRLCIWQSVEQDETLIKVPKSGSGKNDTLTPNSSKTGTSDKLKNFCIEVILPFYMSRLPEKAAAINKRLGGPSASPAKPSGSGSSSHRSRPGEAAVRTDPRSAQRKRRPLSRVATENAAHQPPPRQPSLTRSSTDPTLPTTMLKREGSEAPSLSSIPLQSKDSQTSSSRNSLSQFERFSRRTIDLDAMSKTNEAKLRKKAQIEHELERAIGTLRKPNRGAALKDVAHSADSRRLMSSSKKAGGGVAKKAGERSAVLVGATPKRARRTRDVVGGASAAAVQATPNRRWEASLAEHSATPRAYGDVAEGAPPPSSDPVVPSSAIRPGDHVPGSAVPASVVKIPSRADGGGVEETPSRGPAGKTVRWGLVPSDQAAVAATPEAGAAAGGGGVSRLGERLRAAEAGGGGQGSRAGSSLKMPRPPAFKLPGAPLSRIAAMEEESEGSEDEFKGMAAMLRTPTKAGRSHIMETPVKRRGAVAETPVKDVTSGGESKGKEKATGGEEPRRSVQDDEGADRGGEEVGEASIYSALGWDDDVDELA